MNRLFLKIISVSVSACVCAGSIIASQSVSAQTNVSDGMLNVLSYLNIMSGDPDGNMRLDDFVSRAEFTKMSVSASAYKNNVAKSLAVSPFPDVTYKHWAAPYVRVGVTNGIVNGDSEGIFRPEDTILYEEAVTMMLRVLGYTDTDFGYSWPSGQLGVADNIDLTDDIDRSAGDIMTRRDVAKLVYNALKADMKLATQGKLSSVFNVMITDDVSIVATHNEDSAIGSDSVLTSNGTYKLDIALNQDNVGRKGEVAIKDGNKLIGFVCDDESVTSEEYIVYSVFDDKILAYKNGGTTQLKVNSNTVIYNGGSKTTFEMMKGKLELGDRLRVAKLEAGDIDYITYSEGRVSGPITVGGTNWKEMLGVSTDAKVSRNGATTTVSGIQTNDIVYYLPDINTVLAYNDKVTGIYEKATPNRDNVTSVTVSGKEYNIEGNTAFNKLHSGGEFEYGDTVMLLLGKDGGVADAVSPSADTSARVGYIVATGIKDYQNGNDTFTNYYIKLAQTDGNEYEYVTDRDYSEYKNSVVTVSFKDGNARVSKVQGNSNVGGVFDWNSKKFGTHKLASSVNIIDVGTTDSDYGTMYVKVFGQRLDGINVPSSSVLYYENNSAGEIKSLILKNVTNDEYSYGIVTDVNKTPRSTTYEYMIDGKRYTTTVSGAFATSVGAIAKFSGNISKPNEITTINKIDSKISSMTTESLTDASGKSYKLSDKVQVYKHSSFNSGEYEMISINELTENLSKYNVLAYYDKKPENGGRVRIILVSEK